jgi:hypothetical protein
VKKRELKKLIALGAREAGILFVELRHHGRHEIYLLGNSEIHFGKHVEIKHGEFYAIVKECEPELGDNWWK